MSILLWDDDIEKMFKDIAAALNLGYQKTTARGGDVYNLFYKDKFLVRFNTFYESRVRKIRIIVNFGSMTQRPLSWGAYTKEELADKAKRTITANIIKLIEGK